MRPPASFIRLWVPFVIRCRRHVRPALLEGTALRLLANASLLDDALSACRYTLPARRYSPCSQRQAYSCVVSPMDAPQRSAPSMLERPSSTIDAQLLRRAMPQRLPLCASFSPGFALISLFRYTHTCGSDFTLISSLRPTPIMRLGDRSSGRSDSPPLWHTRAHAHLTARAQG
ncbi:hypothetical protein BD626DRAFT_207770 [Schizophyllum amplum]|uniref:Uncharacterized protein n=1 Tax=Schizophyllum amplum TaxID=97359 RepID=A0A550BYM0_9AGAR|nr:hypothetical protein BD626DRAFT_207770 [Auriculariopsis ampla]